MPLPEYWKGSLTTGRQGLLRIHLKEDSDGFFSGYSGYFPRPGQS